MSAEDNDDVALERLEQEALDSIAQTNGEPTNALYKRCQKKFRGFVDSFDDRLGLTPGKYISEKSVRTFYLFDQKERKCNRDTAMKTVYALNQMSSQEGSDLGDDLMTSSVKETITTILKVIENASVDRSNNCIKDVHESNPTNIIKQEDISKVMWTRLKRAANWVDLIVVWGITSVTLLRFDSSQRLTLDKLFLLKDLPPMGTETPHDGNQWEDVVEPVDGRVLGFLIPPKDQIKKNTAHMERKTEAVGAYRHKRFERCMIGIVAFSLLDRLDKNDISFLRVDLVPDNMTHWTKVKLFDLDYSKAHKNYQKMLEDAGVGKWAKVTHMRYEKMNM